MIRYRAMTPAILPFVHAQGSRGEIGLQVAQDGLPRYLLSRLALRHVHLVTCQTGALSVTVRDRFQPAVPA
jgi:hypothetical protein